MSRLFASSALLLAFCLLCSCTPNPPETPQLSAIEVPPPTDETAAPQAQIPTQEPAETEPPDILGQYRDFLAALDPTRLESYRLAVETPREWSQTLSDEVLTEMFGFFNDANMEGVPVPTDSVFVDTYEEWRDVYAALQAEYEPYYLLLQTGEGFFWVVPDIAGIGQAQSGCAISPAYAAFFDVFKKQKDAELTRLVSDAVLLVPFDSLADVIVWNVGMLDSYPDFPLASYARDNLYSIGWYTGANPLDNSPPWDWETKRLKDEVKQSYELFADSYPDLSVTPLMQDVLAIWEWHNYKYSADVVEELGAAARPYLEALGIG